MAVPATKPYTDNERKLLSQLLGTWKLESYTVHLASKPEDPSTAILPYGPEVIGSITYTPEGYVSMHFCSPGQPNHQSGMPTNSSDAELAESARRYLAYAGTFDATTNDHGELIVLHLPEVSLYPNWKGVTQRRLVRFQDGGQKLVLRPEQSLLVNVSYYLYRNILSCQPKVS